MVRTRTIRLATSFRALEPVLATNRVRRWARASRIGRPGVWVSYYDAVDGPIYGLPSTCRFWPGPGGRGAGHPPAGAIFWKRQPEPSATTWRVPAMCYTGGTVAALLSARVTLRQADRMISTPRTAQRDAGGSCHCQGGGMFARRSGQDTWMGRGSGNREK